MSSFNKRVKYDSIASVATRLPDGPLYTVLSQLSPKDLYHLCHLRSGSIGVEGLKRIASLCARHPELSKRYRQQLGCIALRRMLDWMPITTKAKWFVREFIKRSLRGINRDLKPYFYNILVQDSQVLNNDRFSMGFTVDDNAYYSSLDFYNRSGSFNIGIEKDSAKPNQITVEFKQGIGAVTLDLVIELEQVVGGQICPKSYKLEDSSIYKGIDWDISSLVDNGYFTNTASPSAVVQSKHLHSHEAISQTGSMAPLLNLTQKIFEIVSTQHPVTDRSVRDD